MLLDYLKMRRKTLRKPFLYSYFCEFFDRRCNFEVISVDNSQPCTYHICLLPQPAATSTSCTAHTVLYSYVTTPTCASSDYPEATGSHAVIDFCDRRQAISGTTAHIHYENTDKQISNIATSFETAVVLR